MSGCSCDSDGRTFGGNPYPRTIHRSNRRTVGDGTGAADGRTVGGNPYPRTIHRSNRRTVGDGTGAADGRTFGGNPYPRTIHRSNRRTVGDSNMSLGSNETLPMWRRSRGSSAKREATVLVLLLYDRGSTRGPEVMHVEHTCKGFV